MRIVLSAFLALGLCAGCSDSSAGPDGGGDPTGDGGGGGPDADIPCVGLQCRQIVCAGGGTTSVSGVVTTPKGDLPLYNAIVYVPNGPLAPIETGASCEPCSAQLSGNPLVQTQTDTMGRFRLDNMPVGQDIPLVVQIGKWRRQVTIPAVPECTDTALTGEQTRLPKNQSEGDLPKIALVTGGADALECLLLKVGIDPVEFTPEGGGGRVNLYAGEGGTAKYGAAFGGETLSDATTLWDSLAKLLAYDVVLLSCEGTENPTNKSVQARANVRDFIDMGGRVFASHWQNFFVEHGPDPLPSLATWNHQDDLNSVVADINTTFPKGAALAEWLVNVGSLQPLGKIALKATQHTIDAVASAEATAWITTSTPSVQYFSFNAPLGAQPENQCGRMVVSDIHVSSGDKSNKDYPTGCVTPTLSDQEKALVFMLFDLSACIEPDQVE